MIKELTYQLIRFFEKNTRWVKDFFNPFWVGERHSGWLIPPIASEAIHIQALQASAACSLRLEA